MVKWPLIFHTSLKKISIQKYHWKIKFTTRYRSVNQCGWNFEKITSLDDFTEYAYINIVNGGKEAKRLGKSENRVWETRESRSLLAEWKREGRKWHEQSIVFQLSDFAGLELSSEVELAENRAVRLIERAKACIKLREIQFFDSGKFTKNSIFHSVI